MSARHGATCLVLVFICIARTSSAGRPDGMSIDVALMRANSQALLIADSRPAELATVGGALRVDMRLYRAVGLSVVGQLSGTWSDFDNGAGNSGNVKVLVPGFGIGPVVAFSLSDYSSLTLGGQFEYSEVRSWSHSRVAFLPYDVTGPRNFRRGGVLRASVDLRKTWAQPFVEVTGGAYCVGARAPSLSGNYRWLSTVGSVLVGVRFRML